MRHPRPKFTPEALRKLPVRPVHPAALYALERGLSLRELGKYLGISRSALSRYVTTWRRPFDGDELAQRLGVDLFPVREQDDDRDPVEPTDLRPPSFDEDDA